VSSDVIFSGVYGMPSRMYDWVDPSDQRTREEYPYNFSSHYLFCDGDRGQFGIVGADAVFTDRMRQQDREKASLALKGFSDFGTRPPGDIRKSCRKAVRLFCGPGVKCVGYALTCNQSSGYPIGIFFIQQSKAK
jgi:hypothetical protein